MPTDTEQKMDAVVIAAVGPPAQSLVVRPEPVPEPGPERCSSKYTQPR